MSISKNVYGKLSVYEPVYTTGETLGFNTNFLYGLGGWELQQHPTSIHPNFVKRACTGWKKIDEQLQISTMIMQRTTTSRNYEVHVHSSKVRGTKLDEYLTMAFADPQANTLPVMFNLTTFDGAEFVLFPQKVVYQSSTKAYVFTCADETMLLDSLHVTDNATTSQVINAVCHRFMAEGTIEEILTRLFTCAMFNHLRLINLYTVDDKPRTSNVGKLPVGLLTNRDADVCLYDTWGRINDPSGPVLPSADHQYLYRTCVPSGFKVSVQYRNKTNNIYQFATKKIKLSEVISELDSALKIRVRCSLKFVDGEIVLLVNCISDAPKQVDIQFSNYSIVFDQTNQAHLSGQNLDKVPTQYFDTATLVAYPDEYKNNYTTIYPFMKTVLLDAGMGESINDDMENAMKTPTLKYNFDDVTSSAVMNRDVFVGDTIEFYSPQINRTFTATVNGYTITFSENNKYSQILEIEVI